MIPKKSAKRWLDLEKVVFKAVIFPMTALDLEHTPLEVMKVPNPLEEAMLALIHMQKTMEVMIQSW